MDDRQPTPRRAGYHQESGTLRDLPSVLGRITNEIEAGARHGFFRCTVHITTNKAGLREIVLEAGKQHRFLVDRDGL